MCRANPHFSLLDFASESLSGTIKGLKSAPDGSADETFNDNDLGLGRRDLYVGGEEMYWTSVHERSRITAHLQCHRLYFKC